MHNPHQETPPNIDTLTDETLSDYYVLWARREITIKDLADYLQTDIVTAHDLLARGQEYYQGGN